jgi:hypothetical protein
VVGHNVSMLHMVTLGGSGKKHVDRHPKIGVREGGREEGREGREGGWGMSPFHWTPYRKFHPIPRWSCPGRIAPP